MAIRQSFLPAYGQGQLLTPNTTSASTTIGFGAKSLQLVNSNATLIYYIRVGKGTQTATTADLPLLPNSRIVLAKEQDADQVGYISPGGAGAANSLLIIPGEGHM